MEAREHGLIDEIVYQPGPFVLSPRASVTVEKQLKTKIKTVDKFLFHKHSYTPDFSFYLQRGVLNEYFHNPVRGWVVIDVKGGFNKYGDPKQFSINCKWMWQKYEIFVEKIVPEKLFKKTWVPGICRLSPKQRKPVKKYIGVPVISEFMENQRKKLCRF
jgi:hypothetical protein